MIYLILIFFSCGEEEKPPILQSNSKDQIEEDSGTIPIEDTGDITGSDHTDPVVAFCEDFALQHVVPVDETCVNLESTGTLSFTREWETAEFTFFPEYDQILMAPVVGPLFDSNEDGIISEMDTPSIAVMMDDGGLEGFQNGVLRIFSGVDGEEQMNLRQGTFENLMVLPYAYSGIALGDIDKDQKPDLVFMAEVEGGVPTEPGAPECFEEPEVFPQKPFPTTLVKKCYPVASEVDGIIKWIGALEIDCGGHHPALADLDGNGSVEVVVAGNVLYGENGGTVFEGTAGQGFYDAYDSIGSIPIVADLDNDGFQEVIAGNTAYNYDGSIRCQAQTDDGYAAAADLDMDGEGEWALVGNGNIWVIDGDCSVLMQQVLPGTSSGTGGPPTIGDFDGDGVPEIGIASATHYVVYEADGTQKWVHETTDESSHATGSIIFDFEGDGIPEVVYADEVALWVLDGQDGTVRLQDNDHASRTLHEYPTVVDVDGDNEPEIIVPNGGGHNNEDARGLYVIGASDHSWIGGPKVWNQHAFSHTNIENDLQIPSHPYPNWPLYNSFRSANLNPVYGENAPDAVPVAQVCIEDCANGNWQFFGGIGNQGTAPLRHDVVFSAYDSSDGSLIVSQVIAPPIYPSEVMDGIVIDIIKNTAILEIDIVVDDANGVETVQECVESNNTLHIEAVCE